MASYLTSLFKPPSRERVVELACGTCDNRYGKKTGNWRSDLTIADIQKALKEVCGDEKSKLLRKDGPKGEMIAKVPLDEYELKEHHRYVSSIQAIQRMESCIACGDMCREIIDGETPVNGSFKIV